MVLSSCNKCDLEGSWRMVSGSILALKIWTGTNMRVFLKNMDNKTIENQRKVTSSNYPTRSSNNGHLDWKACKIRDFQFFCLPRDVNMMLEIEPATFPTRIMDTVEIPVGLG